MGLIKSSFFSFIISSILNEVASSIGQSVSPFTTHFKSNSFEFAGIVHNEFCSIGSFTVKLNFISLDNALVNLNTSMELILL